MPWNMPSRSSLVEDRGGRPEEGAASRGAPPEWSAIGLATALVVVVAACGTDLTRGSVPRRPKAPGATTVSPPPRPQYTQVGPQRVSAKPGVDVTREPLTASITADTDPDEAMALRFAEGARRELEEGTTTHAFELLEAAIERSPDSVPPYVVRAQAYLAEGSAENARADLQRAVDRSPPPAWLAEAVAINGLILEMQGDLDGAVASYRRALQISSANVTAREALRRLSSP